MDGRDRSTDDGVTIESDDSGGEDNLGEGGKQSSLDGTISGSDDSGSPDRFTAEWVKVWVRDGVIGVGFVALVLILITAAAGVWPPFSAVESGSMEPDISQGDMTVVTDTDRFVSDQADDNGVVTWEEGQEGEAKSFGDYGSVIVFETPNSGGNLTLHRAMFTVEEGEDWYDRADEEHVEGAASCEGLRNCPAPNSGYITKGDANSYYDQAMGMSPPIEEEWVVGVAEYRIPYVGWMRLIGGEA